MKPPLFYLSDFPYATLNYLSVHYILKMDLDMYSTAGVQTMENSDTHNNKVSNTLEESGEEPSGKETGEQKKKTDVKSLVSIIPPAGALRREEKKLREKRIRVRYGNVKPDQVKINKKLAEELGISEYAELVIAGRKKFRLKVILDDSVPDNVVMANEEILREHGVADNSISTIRRAH